MTLENAIRELYYWQETENDNFHSLLYRLIQKADPENKEKLRLGFREECVAFDLWYQSPNAEDFFKAHLGDV